MAKFYDFHANDNKGVDVCMKEYEGKVLLVVNTATGCGFTPQYEGLQEIYEKYQARGFEILDFPCNQFANQAPGSDEEIASFCSGRYGITFPLFQKIKVNGEDKQIISMHGYKLMGVNKSSKFPESAQLLANYLTDEECQKQRAQRVVGDAGGEFADNVGCCGCHNHHVGPAGERDVFG